LVFGNGELRREENESLTYLSEVKINNKTQKAKTFV